MPRNPSSADPSDQERARRVRELVNDCVQRRAQGEPHLMDFGLAKREAGEITMTVEGKLLGTPAYMSPEQAGGSAHQADRRSDVYSLGVILFELLTGQRPFGGSTRMLLHQVLVEDAPRPRRLNRGIPKDLETICLKCLEKDPGRRYQTAALLRDELQRFLRGDAIEARPITKAERAWRWCKRNRALAALSAACLLVVAASSLIAHKYYSEHRARERARWARQVALPGADRFFAQGDDVAAFELLGKAERYVADDPILLEMWPRMTNKRSVITDPPGATVYFRRYSVTDGKWIRP